MLSASSLKRQAAIFKIQSIFLCFYFFFPKTVFLSTAMQQCGVLLGFFFFQGKSEPCSSAGSWMPAATQPQSSQGSLETLSFCRSLHLHYWATQCLTTGMHLNSSWNCLPSKLGKKGTELQGMATISQKLASWVGKWKVFYPNQ